MCNLNSTLAPVPKCLSRDCILISFTILRLQIFLLVNHSLLLTLRHPGSFRNHQALPCNGTHRHHTRTSDGIRSRAARPPIQRAYRNTTCRVSLCQTISDRSALCNSDSTFHTLSLRSIASGVETYKTVWGQKHDRFGLEEGNTVSAN